MGRIGSPGCWNTRTGLSQSYRKTMSESKPERQELVARTTPRHEIGTDATGATHYYSTYLGTVWTVVDDTIEHVEATRDLDKWRRFIDARRGWVAHRIDSRSTTEFVCDAVVEAL